MCGECPLLRVVMSRHIRDRSLESAGLQNDGLEFDVLEGNCYTMSSLITFTVRGKKSHTHALR